MYGQHLISSPVTSPVQSFSKPTPTVGITDKTARTTELEKGMAQQSFSRESAPSITLGGM
jgi:hypothetical protein